MSVAYGKRARHVQPSSIAASEPGSISFVMSVMPLTVLAVAHLVIQQPVPGRVSSASGDRGVDRAGSCASARCPDRQRVFVVRLAEALQYQVQPLAGHGPNLKREVWSDDRCRLGSGASRNEQERDEG